MLVTLSGMVTLASPRQVAKADAGILVTFFPMFNDTRLVQPLKIESVFERLLLQAVAFQLTVVKPVQLENTKEPMTSTLAGMVMEDNPERIKPKTHECNSQTSTIHCI